MADDWKIGAQAEYERRRQEAMIARTQAVRRMERARRDATAQEAIVEDLDRGAAALGLSVLEKGVVTIVHPDTPAPSEAAPGHQFKDIALGVLRNVFPQPAKAAEVREVGEKVLGRKLHWKTAGMTLYRLKTEGKARRVGQDWYFVPPEQRALFDEEAP